MTIPRKLRKAQRASPKGERFIKLPHYMVACEAWLTLPPTAMKLLFEVWKRHNGVNNGEITYSVREAEAIGLSLATAARNFTHLVERGFLKVRKDSSFDLKRKEARVWEITAEPCRQKSASKEFLRWSAGSAKKKNTVPSMERSVPSMEQVGPETALDATKLPISVPSAEPTTTESTPSQFHQRNTYKLPGGGPLSAVRGTARAGRLPSSPAECSDAIVVDLDERFAGALRSSPSQSNPEEPVKNSAAIANSNFGDADPDSVADPIAAEMVA